MEDNCKKLGVEPPKFDSESKPPAGIPPPMGGGEFGFY